MRDTIILFNHGLFLIVPFEGHLGSDLELNNLICNGIDSMECSQFRLDEMSSDWVGFAFFITQ